MPLAQGRKPRIMQLGTDPQMIARPSPGAQEVLDLSTEFSLRPWPGPACDPTRTPPEADVIRAASAYYRCPEGHVLPCAGVTADRLAALVARALPPPKHRVIDETTLDPRPDLSLAADVPPGTVLLRSLRPLWGLRGAHVLIARPESLAVLRQMVPPLPAGLRAKVAAALRDADHVDQALLYLTEATLWLDRAASRAGWQPIGGSHYVRHYRIGDAAAEAARLAASGIRVHHADACTLRLAIPVARHDRDRLSRALRQPPPGDRRA